MSAQEWSREYDALRHKLDSARNDIDRVISYERSGNREQYTSLKNTTGSKLRDVVARYPALKQQLPSIQSLTENEVRRRKQNLRKLERDYTDIKALLDNKNNERGTSNRSIEESHESMALSNTQMKQTQVSKQRNQDEDLDQILQGVKRINGITYDINTELERQDVIIDEIGDAMDTANSKVSTNVKRVTALNKKSKDKGCCLLMTLLFLAIIALLVWNLAG